MPQYLQRDSSRSYPKFSLKRSFRDRPLHSLNVLVDFHMQAASSFFFLSSSCNICFKPLIPPSAAELLPSPTHIMKVFISFQSGDMQMKPSFCITTGDTCNVDSWTRRLGSLSALSSMFGLKKLGISFHSNFFFDQACH